MGVSYNKPVSQWSKGEYADPSNTQDDLAVMLTQGAVYRPDDHGGTVATATKLSAESSSATGNGVIERNTDLAKLPVLSTSGGNMVFTFIRDQDSIDGGTTLVIETGGNLMNWPDFHPVPDTSVSNNPGLAVLKNAPAAGKDTIILTLPLNPGARFFARLKAVP